jgi:hypothetical protein
MLLEMNFYYEDETPCILVACYNVSEKFALSIYLALTFQAIIMYL